VESRRSAISARCRTAAARANNCGAAGAWQVGYEGGGLVTWKNGRTEFRGNSNAVLVRIDNTFGAVGVFMGGVSQRAAVPSDAPVRRGGSIDHGGLAVRRR
jgi:hypothetical protein